MQAASIALVTGPRSHLGQLVFDHVDAALLTASSSAAAVETGAKGVVIRDDFIFAINDQELEINQVEPCLLLAARVY